MIVFILFNYHNFSVSVLFSNFDVILIMKMFFIQLQLYFIQLIHDIKNIYVKIILNLSSYLNLNIEKYIIYYNKQKILYIIQNKK